MYDANRVLGRLRLIMILAYLLMLLKCIAVYDSVTKSKKSASYANIEWSSDEDSDWSLTYKRYFTTILQFLKMPEFVTIRDRSISITARPDQTYIALQTEAAETCKRAKCAADDLPIMRGNAC